MTWLCPLQCSPRGCHGPSCAKSSRPFSYLTGSLQHLTGLIIPSFLNCTSLAPWRLVFSLPLWLLPPVSCTGFSTCPMHHGVSQGSVVGSLEEPIHADGFDSVKELRVDLQRQHPSWASEPQSCCLWVHRPLSWHLLLPSADLPLLGTCCGPKISQEPDQKPVPYIQSLKTVKFAFLTFLD